MTNARTVLLGDVCKFVGGGTPSRAQPEYFQGDIPWATVKDFKTFLIKDTEEHISELAITDSATNIINPGTVLLVTRVGLGKVAIAGCRLAINQDVKAITPTDDVLPEFLFWFLLAKSNDIKQMGAGATVKGVTLNDIKSITMPLPTIAEQHRIVDILSRAEGIVRLRREAEKKAAELIPAMFLDMFGDPATNPKGWPTMPFGELVDNKDGKRKPIKSADRDNRHGPYPYYGASGIIDTYDNFLFDGEHLLIAEDGANLLSRSTPIAFLASGKYWVNNHAHVVAANGKANLTFLECLLNLRDLRDFITGSAQPKLNQANMNGIPIMNAPLPMQERFASQVEQIRSIQLQQATSTEMAQATFDALLSQVFQA